MIVAVVLAAGASTRMGLPKALLQLGDRRLTFVEALVRALHDGGAADVVVVLAPDGEGVRRTVARLDPAPRVLINPDPARGQLSSLHTAIDAVDRPGVRGLLAAPVDSPLIASDLIRRLIDAHHAGGSLIVRPARGERHGHPVLFDARLFGELRGADPGRGARAVVAAHAGQILDLHVEEDGPFLDIDTPADYERIFGRPPILGADAC